MNSRLRWYGGGVVVGVVAILAALIAPAGAVIYTSFPASDPNLQLNGSASLTGSALQLTPQAQSQAGSAFLKTQQPTSSFSSRFQATLTPPATPPGGCLAPDTKADGVTFTVQHDPRGATALGGGGGSLGYSGITPSLAVELDIFKNTNPPDQGSDNHLAINTNGALTDQNLVNPGFNMADGARHTYWVDYDATAHTVKVYAAATGLAKPATPLITYSDNLATRLGPSMFAGFTGATGACDALQVINSWLFCSVVNNPSGSVIVPSGSTYCITGNVPGNVVVQGGGSAIFDDATVNGNVQSTDATGFQMCGTRVSGSVTVTHTTGFVLVGDGGQDGCNPNQMSSLTINQSTAGFEASGNVVNGNLSANLNNVAAGSTDEAGAAAANIIENNNIAGTLSCTSNTPTPTNEGGMNQAPSKTGQCSSI